jgi:diadenosine tetraphosphate (Ap4A) HIT family hydrolase
VRPTSNEASSRSPRRSSASRHPAAQRANCPLCAAGRTDLPAESAHTIVLPDPFPQSRGHALVVPRAHVASIFDLPANAQADVLRLVARVRSSLMAEHAPDGFRVGIDDGGAARRSVEHAHVHVIPSYRRGRTGGRATADTRGIIRFRHGRARTPNQISLRPVKPAVPSAHAHSGGHVARSCGR